MHCGERASARLTCPRSRCIGVAVNTSKLATELREPYLRQLSAALNLPCVDPMIDGVAPLVDRMLQ
ncbi:MAG: DUF1611 domain-containing protein [Rhodospirillales bacterium]|nr:DUF1611 domain-containing protein [Rhodospirillales bacterium]